MDLLERIKNLKHSWDMRERQQVRLQLDYMNSLDPANEEIFRAAREEGLI